MAGSSLLTLLDDIATILDDVAILSKTALKKTSGVLGDDLALNAEQVTGVKANRELPVIWAVAKGSFLNKLILVPAALLISAFLPWLITPLLMIGGTYLCYEGSEKVLHKWFHKQAHIAEKDKLLRAFEDPTVDKAQFEANKIKGAIRTDFILSAEIIVIALGSVQNETFLKQSLVVSTIALTITILVYGLVAAIVKLDDAGLYLLQDRDEAFTSKLKRLIGQGLLSFAPKFMKLIAFIGTLAMFLVGGGIIIHGLHWLAIFQQELVSWAVTLLPLLQTVDWLISSAITLVIGFLIGLILMPISSVIKQLTKTIQKNDNVKSSH